MTPRPSQNERLLALLGDGRWHTTAEILREVPCVLHSRISELRARGVEIDHQGVGGGASEHSYRLATSGEAVPPAVSPDAAVVGGGAQLSILGAVA